MALNFFFHFVLNLVNTYVTLPTAFRCLSPNNFPADLNSSYKVFFYSDFYWKLKLFGEKLTLFIYLNYTLLFISDNVFTIRNEQNFVINRISPPILLPVIYAFSRSSDNTSLLSTRLPSLLTSYVFKKVRPLGFTQRTTTLFPSVRKQKFGRI